MWLLSSNRAELHHFTDHTVVPGGYAILSHTWGPKEQTYQEVRAIQAECQSTGKNPRDCVNEKIRESCRLAERHGYRWIWIDSCCIDKSSSSELSEAINSMFTWYSNSEVCYAFLEDVPSSCDLAAPGAPFRRARWHTRGWTLQELIAPSLVVFVSNDWILLGTKDKLADLLSDITGIWPGILTSEEHYASCSVAVRMCWASKRNTSRVEDEAYCLMGLFNVNMPTIYGEGRRAFQRLQEEIMKRTFDTSLFAWGGWIDPTSIYEPLTPEGMRILDLPNMSLLASSPSDFMIPYYYSPNVSDPLQPYLSLGYDNAGQGAQNGRVKEPRGPFGELALPRFGQTSYGIECRFPVFEMDGVTVAILLCECSKSHIGLFLHPSPERLQDRTRKMYRVGFGFTTSNGKRRTYRIMTLGADYGNIQFGGRPVGTIEWRDICIQHDPDGSHEQAHSRLMIGRLKGLVNNICLETPFRIPRSLSAQFTSLGFSVGSSRSLRYFVQSHSDGLPSCWTAISFENLRLPERIQVVLGTCIRPSGENVVGSTMSHWAIVDIRYLDTWYEMRDWAHDCSRDHIEGWPQWTKEFRERDRIVRLSFARCPITPATTVVMHLELDGPVYERLSEEKKLPLPSTPKQNEVLRASEDSSSPVQLGEDSSAALDVERKGSVALEPPAQGDRSFRVRLPGIDITAPVVSAHGPRACAGRSAERVLRSMPSAGRGGW